jgi:hypothetical protein
VVAVLLNAVLFGVGVYFEMHPRDRDDVWSAAGVAGVALFNSAALSVPASGSSARPMRRMRRIALLANSLLLVVSGTLVGLELLRGWRRDSLLHGVALLVPPIVTIVALRSMRRV